MEASQQRKLDQYQSKIAFMRENQADFPAISPGGRTTQSLEEAVQSILSLAGQQGSNAYSQHIGIKADNLDKLIRLLRKMNRAANSMADEHESVENLFRLPRRRSEQTWLATARAFYADSENYKADFVEYYLPATFRDDLIGLIEAIESSGEAADIAGTQKGGATGALAQTVRTAGKYSRKLDGIVENKYDDNPRKLAEWKIASHLKAAPQKATEEAEEK